MYFEASLKDRALKFLRLVSKSYARLPRDITIEVSTRCGQQCPMCFRAPLGVRESAMDYGLFSDVVSGLRSAFAPQQPAYINFVGLGEPFLNGSLGRMLRLVKTTFPKTGINVSTSLAVFDRILFESLAAENVINRISVSVDSPAGGGSLHPFSGAVAENLDFLGGLKARCDFKIRLQALMSSKERALEVVELAKRSGADEVQLMRIDLHAFKGKPPVGRPALEEERRIVRAAARLGKKYGIRCRNNNSYDIFMDLASAFDKYCLITDDSVFIDVEGNVLPCFYLRNVSFGNLARTPLSGILGKKRGMSFYDEQARLCAGCDIYKRRHRP